MKKRDPDRQLLLDVIQLCKANPEDIMINSRKHLGILLQVLTWVFQITIVIYHVEMQNFTVEVFKAPCITMKTIYMSSYIGRSNKLLCNPWISENDIAFALWNEVCIRLFFNSTEVILYY